MTAPADFVLDLFSRVYDQSDRPVRLRFAGVRGRVFEGTLVPQRADITEAICDGRHERCRGLTPLTLRQAIHIARLQILSDQ